MSIKDLFDSENNLLIGNDKEFRDSAESLDNAKKTLSNRQKFIPNLDFGKPENFVRYGSAESYYSDAITRIYENYPYDGSSKEKQEYIESSNYIDQWIFDNKYPRTNGFITISAHGSRVSLDTLSKGYGNPTNKEYINFFGGPHTASGGMIGKLIGDTFDGSNKYDENVYDDQGFSGTGTRESNLKTNFDNGVTIEFWLKKDEFKNSETEKEVIFDLWNNTTSSADSYGRILLQLTGTLDRNFILTVQSGASTPYSEYAFGADTTQTTLQTFGHYAFRIYNTDQLNVDFYKNGQLLESQKSTPTLNEITGALQANIGALTSPALIGSDEYADKGWGKLSGSLDEFRFWKTKRTSEQIGRYWFDQIYGGTNTDISNTDLGVYFKFNEGITGDDSIDSTVLDYSGRITNGAWTGYGTNSRSTGSAIVIAAAADSEFKDPIIYPEHPKVESVLQEMKLTGSTYDFQNNSQIYDMMPNWIIDEDTQESENLKKLTQIMASYLDTLQMQIEYLPKIKEISYPSGSLEGSFPFMDSVLSGFGLDTTSIFVDSSILNQVFARSETENFEKDLTQIKNSIYKNLYNNLQYIYKTKGTEKSFRNLIRCYGLSDKVIDINMYSNNVVYQLQENYRSTSTKKKYLNFYDPENFGGTVYQQTASSVPASTSYITASVDGKENYTSFTMEVDAIFPEKRKTFQENYFSTNFNTASIAGFHSVNKTNPTPLTYASPDYDLSLYCIRPDINENKTDAFFMLTSSYFGIELRTKTYPDVYKNSRWSFAVRFKPEKHQSNFVSGSDSTTYSLDFYGINNILDITKQEFNLYSSNLSTSGIENLLSHSKRLYAGSHRQNFTGSLIYQTDIKLGSVRYWLKYLEDEDIKAHARDPDNYGISLPDQNSYIFPSSLVGKDIPNIKTLALNWSFDNLSKTDSLGNYSVSDLSSGSAGSSEDFSWLGPVVNVPHPATAAYFSENSQEVTAEYLPTAKQKNPEILNPVFTSVKILSTGDQEEFVRTTRPSKFYYMIEKSMYNTITEEMLNFFSSVVDFGTIIGSPVERYRPNYKGLSHLRKLFFKNIENDPDIEKYIEYYKWVDSSLGYALRQLKPANSEINDDISTMIESHLLERSKYRSKKMLFGTVVPDIAAIVDRSLSVAWSVNTPTLPESPPPTNKHCYWWKNRADRTNYRITSGDSGVDAARNAILAVTQTETLRKRPVITTMTREEIYGDSVYKNKSINNYVKSSIQIGSSEGYEIPESKVKDFIDCQDEIYPVEKKRWSYSAQNQISNDEYEKTEGHLTSPFTAVSSSVKTGYISELNSNFKQGFGVENYHKDSYFGDSAPMQGTFTETWVGGNQHRHVPLNTGNDSPQNRPEAWSLKFQSSPNALRFIYQPINSPRATLYRDLVAKRSVNIANIKSTNTTQGNYAKDYEIVHTAGRSINNSAYTKQGGFTIQENPSIYIAGMEDYKKPDRGRTEHVVVNRFSSPGAPDTAGDSNGGPGLDSLSAEYSPYNNMNYRNTTVRDINRLLLSSHVNQFGFYSNIYGIGPSSSQVNSLNYEGTGSLYQVNRNPIKQNKYISGSYQETKVYDNYWVQHPIPRSDLQYAWITASVSSYDTYGYLPYSGYISSSNGDISLITFNSSSSNYDYIWKQVRNFDNKQVIQWNKNGQTAYNLPLGQSYVDPLGNTYTPRTGERKIVKDSPVISKYKPLDLSIKAKKVENNNFYDSRFVSREINMDISYGNSLGRFSNRQITNDLGLENLSRKTSYDAVLNMYNQGALQEQQSPITEFEMLMYSEQVYPSPFNSYSKENRERTEFSNTFWRNNIENRVILGDQKFGGKNSQGFQREQSAWGLDASKTFGEPCPTTITSASFEGLSTYVAHNYSTGAAGELQNDYTFYWARSTSDTVGSSSLLVPSPILSRKQDVRSIYSVVTPTGMESIVANITSSTHLTSYENLTTSEYAPNGILLARGGNAKFETHNLAGYVRDGVFTSSSATPFYDKYEQYNLEMRLKNKDMSIIPEYRMGSHIDKYLSDSDGFLSPNTASYEIFGANSGSSPLNSSQSDFYKTYSFSDFMEHFDVIDEDHKEFDLDKNLTLSCKALMKFIPYDGFYPAERTLEIASAFSQSYTTFISCSGGTLLAASRGERSDPLKNRPIYEPLFSPGILFNTIKSGIAVDYPIYTASYDRVGYINSSGSHTLPGYSALGTGSSGTNGWDYRVDFETLLTPEKINNIPIADMNTDLISSVSPLGEPIRSTLNAPSRPNKYKLMINNFLAEVPTFFMEGLTSIKSTKDGEFVFKPNTKYGMRIKMERSMNKKNQSPYDFPVPQDYPLTGSGLHETITMYSRPTAFGPAVAGSNTVTSASLQCDSQWGLNPSFTPPYYNGQAWADIVYDSGNTTGSISLSEVIASSSVNYLRIYPGAEVWPQSDPTEMARNWPMESAHANKFSMQLSASVNLLDKDSEGKWCIQTKFETPILNFGDKTARPLNYNNISLPCIEFSDNSVGVAFTNYTLGYGGQTTTPIGMWHQFGLIPQESEGIFLSVSDIDEEFLKYNEYPGTFYDNIQESLADVVGFNKESKKLGQLNTQKTVFEAVVAVPFVEARGCDKEFFELSSDSEDIRTIREKLNKYIFPPEFDFVRNESIKPISMYIFEFSHTFDRDDLSHIWQNVSPKFGKSHKTSTSTISHPLMRGQRLEDLSDKVRWMVFKVKQRAKMNYYDNIEDPKKYKLLPPNVANFGYNWPYDYFSMVEFAKLESTVTFGEKSEDKKKAASTTSVPNTEVYSKDLSFTGKRSASDSKELQNKVKELVEANKQIKKSET